MNEYRSVPNSKNMPTQYIYILRRVFKKVYTWILIDAKNYYQIRYLFTSVPFCAS